MSGVDIGNLPPNSTLTGTEAIPADQSGTTIKIPLSTLSTYVFSESGYVDSNSNVVIGNGCAAPSGGGPLQGCVSVGLGAGVGTSATYVQKLIAIGNSAAINVYGQSIIAMGAFTAARAMGDYAVYYGTHAGQDLNVPGMVFAGYGVRATGSVSLSSNMVDGDTITFNSLVLTARNSPALSTDFQIGSTATATTYNLFCVILSQNSPSVLQGMYQILPSNLTSIAIASTSRGPFGNRYTLSTTSSHVTLSGATLTGGASSVAPLNTAFMSGTVAVGFGSLLGTTGTGAKFAVGNFSFSANPANGSSVAVGFGLTTTINFKSSPTGSLDVQIGSNLSQTVANAIILLNGSTNTTVNQVTYWGVPTSTASTPKLFMEHKSSGVNTFYIHSLSSTITADSWHLKGGTSSSVTTNVALGQQALSNSFASGCVAVGQFSGSFSSLVNSCILGNASYINGQNIFAWGTNTLTFTEGDDLIVLGSNIGGATQDVWLNVASIDSTGTITFTAPHGWKQGSIYACTYQDVTGGSTVFEATTYLGSGPFTSTPLSTATSGLDLVAINAMQAQIPITYDAGTGMPTYLYSVNPGGIVGNLQVARVVQKVENAISIGNYGSITNNTIHMGSSVYTGGLVVDAVGIKLTSGQLALPTTYSPTWATGLITFPSSNINFASGDTVTLNGTVFTAQPRSCQFTAVTTSGSNQITMLYTGFGFPVKGQQITGTNIPANTTITGLGTGPGGFGTLTISNNATGTSAATGVAIVGTGIYDVIGAPSIRYFPIGLTIPDSINNLLACIRNSNDGSAAAKAVNQGTFYLSNGGGGWTLNFTATTTLGNSYTLATSYNGAVVSAPSGGILGGLPTISANSINAPIDQGIMIITNAPTASGYVKYTLSTDSWALI